MAFFEIKYLKKINLIDWIKDKFCTLRRFIKVSKIYTVSKKLSTIRQKSCLHHHLELPSKFFLPFNKLNILFKIFKTFYSTSYPIKLLSPILSEKRLAAFIYFFHFRITFSPEFMSESG